MKVLFKFSHTLVGHCPLCYARPENQLMDQRLGDETRISQAWVVLRFQFEALTHLPASFPSRLFHEVGIPWKALRVAIGRKWGAEERQRRPLSKTLKNSGKSIKQTDWKPKRWAPVNTDLLKASNVKWIFPL